MSFQLTKKKKKRFPQRKEQATTNLDYLPLTRRHRKNSANGPDTSSKTLYYEINMMYCEMYCAGYMKVRKKFLKVSTYKF